MDYGLFGVRFLFLGIKSGAVAPVDYLSTFATAPDDWNRLKTCGNHLLPARGFRQDATHRLDRCIVAPSFRGVAHGLRLWKQSWPFLACVLSLKITTFGEHFFHKLTGAVLTEQQLQEQTDLFIRDGFRMGKVAF